MSFPWLAAEGFEAGTRGTFDSESDTDSVLDFAHYADLARLPWPQAAPFRGAYVARWRLNGGTNDATLTEGAVDVAADGTFGVYFPLFIGPDFVATADDTLNLLELQATGTVELAVGLRITAATGAIEIGVGETAPTQFSAQTLDRGRWYEIEVTGNVDAGVGNDGDATLYVDGVSRATVTTLDQGAITDLVLGVQNQLATTTGTLYIDSYIADEGRVYPMVDRYSPDVLATYNVHVLLGPGRIENLTLLAGNGTDCVVEVYDTDRGNTTDAQKRVLRLNNVTANEVVDPAGVPVDVTRGAYVVLTGTTPRAQVQVSQAVALSPGGVRAYGLRSRVNPLEVL